MYANDDEEERERKFGWLVWGLGGALAILTALSLALTSAGVFGGHQSAGAAATGDDVLVLADDESKVVVDANGVVKFYFAVAKADVATGAQAALSKVVAGVKDGKKAVVSGFHDKTGNAQFNEELSKRRAVAIKDVLMQEGVPESQIELKKPADTQGTGSNAQARRVEVVLE